MFNRNVSFNRENSRTAVPKEKAIDPVREEIAISLSIVAIRQLSSSSRCRGRPYEGRYQFYMTLHKLSGNIM